MKDIVKLESAVEARCYDGSSSHFSLSSGTSLPSPPLPSPSLPSPSLPKNRQFFLKWDLHRQETLLKYPHLKKSLLEIKFVGIEVIRYFVAGKIQIDSAILNL